MHGCCPVIVRADRKAVIGHHSDCIHQQETGKKAKTTRSAGKKPVAPVAVKEVKVRQQTAQLRLSLKQRPQLPLLPFKP